jgi:arylsulfatase A-like enzyme
MSGRGITRRDWLRTAAFGAGALCLGSRTAFAQQRRPNVVVILTDDQGTLDTHRYGAEDLDTPSMDALAARGVRFTQFYAASAICSASRAGLLTGRYPHRVGVPSNAESHPNKFGSGHGLSEDEITMAAMFKASGYRTGHFGKWHLGAEPGPNQFGFDESIGFLGGCIDKWSHFNYGGDQWGQPPRWHDWHHNGKEVYASGRHSGDMIAHNAADFITKSSDDPFFIYAAFGSPHYPMQPYDKYLEHYAHLDEPRRHYAALVSTVDEQIGVILDAIDRAGQRENTIVVFQSDHGHSTEARCNYGGGYAGPYRGAKGCLFEGGIRVPAIVSWPGTLPENEARDQFAVACDWLPTLAALTGVEPPDRKLDGLDISSLVREANAKTPHASWHWALGDQWAVRKGDWKLLGNARDTVDRRNIVRFEEPFLVNVTDDPSEQQNLAAEQPEITQELAAIHEDWLKSI